MKYLNVGDKQVKLPELSENFFSLYDKDGGFQQVLIDEDGRYSSSSGFLLDSQTRSQMKLLPLTWSERCSAQTLLSVEEEKIYFFRDEGRSVHSQMSLPLFRRLVNLYSELSEQEFLLTWDERIQDPLSQEKSYFQAKGIDLFPYGLIPSFSSQDQSSGYRMIQNNSLWNNFYEVVSILEGSSSEEDSEVDYSQILKISPMVALTQEEKEKIIINPFRDLIPKLDPLMSHQKPNEMDVYYECLLISNLGKEVGYVPSPPFRKE